MKRFAKVMALFAVLLLTLYVFDKLQPTLKPTLTGFAVYETRQLTWDFDTESDYSYDSSLINLSGGEVKLRLTTAAAEIADPHSPPLKLPNGNNSELSLTEISDSKYKTAMLNVGDKYYVDKNYKITALPAELQGMLWLKTQQSDHDSKKNVSFATNKPARVLAGYDKSKGTAPYWMQSWTYWGQGITTEDDDATPFKLYYRDFAAGNIILGSNNRSEAMYVILLNNTGYMGSYEYISTAREHQGEPKTVAFEAEKPEGTSVKLQIRTAGSAEGLESVQWLGPTSASDYYETQGQAVNSAHGSSGGWVQYKAVLETANAANTPTLSSVTITAEKPSYSESAAITTGSYTFQKAVEVQQVTADEALNGQSTSYTYSTDSGSTWAPATLNSPMSVKAGKIAVRATLSSNKTHTPAVKSVTVSYKIIVCDEKWQANYTSCGKDDKRTKYYTDANSCGSTEDLPADNGTAETCDYCIPEWTNENSSCRNDDTIAVNYSYTNNCCSETGLPSDCAIPRNTTAACDYCTPSWHETNGSCGKNDAITAAFSDASSCYGKTGLASDNLKPQNKTYSCDYCTPYFACASYGSCSEGNAKACAQVNDASSCYEKTGLASDNYTGNYSEFAASCVYDSEAPVIGDVTAAVSADTTLTVTASITDKSATTATARIIKDGSAVMNVTLTSTTPNIFAGTASISTLKGAHILTVVAKDKYGNAAIAKGTAGFATLAEKTVVKEFALNGSRKALLQLTNTTQVELAGKAAASLESIRLVLSEHNADILNTTKPQERKELGKYIEIEAAEEVKSNVSLATIKIGYSDEEAAAANVSEASLTLYYYNETSSLWQGLSSAVNTVMNYVEGNTTHLSLFGVFGNEITTNNTATNATANQTTPGGEQQQQQTAAETSAAATSGNIGSSAEKAQEDKTKQAQEEKEPETTAEVSEAGKRCTYDVSLELTGNPSFVNKTQTNATLTNTGTCELQNIEIKATQPLDAYIIIENSKKAELKPLESFGFTIKLKAAAEAELQAQLQAQQQKQPVQGFAVKEPRRITVHNGKIVITGQGVKGLGLNAESGELQLREEVPLNIEVYELEQKGGKSSIAATAIGILVLITLLGMLYSRVRQGKKDGGGSSSSSSKNSENKASGQTAARNGEEKTVVEKNLQEQPHEQEKGTPGFEEGLKRFEEKWKQDRQNLFSEKDLPKTEFGKKGSQENEQHEKSLEGFRETFK